MNWMPESENNHSCKWSRNENKLAASTERELPLSEQEVEEKKKEKKKRNDGVIALLRRSNEYDDDDVDGGEQLINIGIPVKNVCSTI